MPPLVSILIPCYNTERWIAQAIESALAQTWPNKEVIVMDDGSTDGSLDIIHSFGDRIRWETGPNRGGNMARNRLLELATGEWLQYLDADDYLLSDKIAGQLADAPASPPADLLFSPMTLEHCHDGQPPVRELLEIPQPHDVWVLMARWLFPGTHAVLFRREAIRAVGGWKPDQPCCQEHELFLRLLKAGKQFAYCPRPGAIYRQWSEATVCKRDPLLSMTKRLEILNALEQHLLVTGQMSRSRQDAIAQSRLECARNMYRFAPETAVSVARRMQDQHARFRIAKAAAFPFAYRAAYRLFGFSAAESLSVRTRSWRQVKQVSGERCQENEVRGERCKVSVGKDGGVGVASSSPLSTLTSHLSPHPPLVSILIPCYNAEQWIGQAIHSALDQTWPNKEIIVVDDGSTDGGLGIIRSFGDQIRWETGPNRGGNMTRNRLLELAAGQWLQYLDADDYLLPEKIERQFEIGAEAQKADLIFSPSRLEHWKGGRLAGSEVLPMPTYTDPWVLLARWQLPNTTTVLWRRAAIVDVGGWKPDQPCCQEHELYSRLLQARKRFAFCAHAGAIYRQWSDGTVCKRNPLLSYIKRLEVLDAVEAHLLSSNELIAPRQGAIAHARLECARGIYRFDRQRSVDCAGKALSQYPEFRLPAAACFPWAYRAAFRLAGFETTERIAEALRRWRALKPNGH